MVEQLAPKGGPQLGAHRKDICSIAWSLWKHFTQILLPTPEVPPCLPLSRSIEVLPHSRSVRRGL